MYTNINTEHGLSILSKFLHELREEGKLPDNWDIKMILCAAELIMKWNLFEYGDSYFLQLTGTAMGTPTACLWAIIYYFWHEKHTLIPKYGNKMPLMVRYIDDLLGVALIGGEDGLSNYEWSNFKRDMDDFGILTWEVNDPSTTVDYLDVTLKIENGEIISKTYQKPINLYQYITPNSAHME